MGSRQLTATSYAILGQLALRPWTTYELVVEMRRNLHYFWPRAETLIYGEVKRLAGLGLASAEYGFTGRRRKTIYAITPDGEAALRAWLATPPERLLTEFEGLLRVIYAPFGTTDDLIDALEKVRADAEEILVLAARIREEYLAGRAPFQMYIHVRAHVYDFLVSHALTVRDWADRALADVRSWEGLSREEREARALTVFARGPASPSPSDHSVPGNQLPLS